MQVWTLQLHLGNITNLLALELPGQWILTSPPLLQEVHARAKMNIPRQELLLSVMRALWAFISTSVKGIAIALTALLQWVLLKTKVLMNSGFAAHQEVTRDGLSGAKNSLVDSCARGSRASSQAHANSLFSLKDQL